MRLGIIVACALLGRNAMEPVSILRWALAALLIGALSPAAGAVSPQDEFGQRIGTIAFEGDDTNIDDLDVTQKSSMMRVAPYLTHLLKGTPPESIAAFAGSGTSPSDMIRPARSSEVDYAGLLYGYLNHIDAGGSTTLVEFYRDGNGCDTDIVKRQSPNGSVHIYFVDTTGWLDGVVEEATDRDCTR